MISESAESRFVVKLIAELMQGRCEVTLRSPVLLDFIPATLYRLDHQQRQLTLDVDGEGHDLVACMCEENLSFDIEARRWGSTEMLSFDRLPVEWRAMGEDHYRVTCTLPDSVFVSERRGGMRVPFLQGMRAQAQLSVYEDSVPVEGLVRNLSRGGCLIAVPIAQSAILAEGRQLHEISLTFPNGQVLTISGTVRHLRLQGRGGYVAVGIEFAAASSEEESAVLGYVVGEAEREVGHRTGAHLTPGRHGRQGGSPLFYGGKDKVLRPLNRYSDAMLSQGLPMMRGVMDIARHLQALLFQMKHHDSLNEDLLSTSAETMAYLLRTDAQAVQFAVSRLEDVPEWLSYALHVTAVLGRYLLARPDFAGQEEEVLAATMIHTMGKPLLLGEQLHHLEPPLSHDEKRVLRGHVQALLGRLASVGWTPTPLARDILMNCHERLDGSGYPRHLKGEQLSGIVRFISVIKAVYRLCHPGPDQPFLSPLDIYRYLAGVPDRYDRDSLHSYIRQQGAFPIGSLVRFTLGFLAWVVATDNDGQPSRVWVVKNLAYPDTTLDTYLSFYDFPQLGQLERVVSARDYLHLFTPPSDEEEDDKTESD